MYKQYEYLREGVTWTRGESFRIDLPEQGQLACVFMKVSANCTSGATLADELWRLQDHLATVEVIGNGATVIKSLEWKQAEYFHWLRNKSNPLNAWRNYAANTQFEYLPLFFGRWLWDREFGLDLGKWDNVELRLPAFPSATYYSTDGSLSLLLGYWRENSAGFRGYLRTEEWREWTTVQNEWKYFTLPTEFPISGVHVRALPDTTAGAADTNGANQMYDIDFSMNGGTKRIYVGGLDDLALLDYYEIGGSLITSGQADVNADRGISVSQLRTLGWSADGVSKDGAAKTADVTETADETDGTVRFEDREADRPASILNLGYGYQHMAALWHSQELNQEDLLDPASAGEMRLNIHTRDAAAAADGTNQIVLERVVTR